MEKFTSLTGVAAPLAIRNVDTDMIIPKQYLKTIKRTGLGKGLFSEMRYNEDGSENPDFVLNKPAYRHAQILVAEDNFGCGSSREHAPQSLAKYGFRAVIAESFAEIFFGNSTTLAMPCVTLTAGEIDQLRQAVEADPAVEITIDLVNKRVRSSTGLDFPLNIAESARDSLVAGRWDPIQELLDRDSEIIAKAKELQYA